MIISKCQLCNGKLNKVFSLGKQPLCDDLITVGSKRKNKLTRLISFFVKIVLLHTINI